jgi:probable F420-dependent oxidoreductase
MVELGRVGIWTDQLDRLPAAELRDTLKEVESAGFRSIWLGEGRNGREAFTNATLVLAVTERLLVANGVASIHARHAAASASAQRVLTEAFPHRFLLGLGLGHDGLVSAPIDDERTAMKRYLRGVDVQPAGVLPAPPAPPPRVIAAWDVEMLEIARDHAQGAHPSLMPPEHTRLAHEILGPGRVLAPEQGVLLEEDPGHARLILREELATRLVHPTYRETLTRLGWTDGDLSGGGSDALIDRVFAWGSLSDVAKRVEEHLEAGADSVALHVVSGRSGPVPLDGWRALAALL